MSTSFASTVRVAAPVTAGPRRRAARGTGPARAPQQRTTPLRQSSYGRSLVNGGRLRSLTKVAAEEGGSKPPVDTPTGEKIKSKNDEGAQFTAIITGGISLVLSIGYLLLVNALGDRELLPPPPEALGL